MPFLKKNPVFWEPLLNLPLSGGEDNFPPLQGEGWGGVMSLIEKIFLKIQHHLIETVIVALFFPGVLSNLEPALQR